MVTKFVVFAHPRTGSYNLISLLSSASDIACYGELFKPQWIELDENTRDSIKIKTKAERDAEPLEFIDELISLSDKPLFGFKLFNYHLHRLPKLVKELDTPAWKIVILCRDPIETYASTLRAQRTNIWTLKEGQAKPDAGALHEKVSFSTESLDDFAKFYNRFITRSAKWVESKPNDTFVIYYDQIGAYEPMRALLKFIGSSAVPSMLKSEYKRQFSAPVEDGFSNFGAMQDYTRLNWPFNSFPPTSVARG